MDSNTLQILILVGVGLMVWQMLSNGYGKNSVETYSQYPDNQVQEPIQQQQQQQQSPTSTSDEEYVDENVVPHYQSENGLAQTTQHGQLETVQDTDPVMSKHVRDKLYQTNTNVLPNPQMSNNYSSQGAFQPDHAHNFSQLDCFPKDTVQAEDLLPREDKYHIWNESNPNVQGHLSNKNFIEAAHHYGLNTVSNSLRNANRQLRSDPLIPKKNVGPWNQSTYEADTNRRPFEIGGC